MAYVVNVSGRVCSYPFCGEQAVADVFSDVTASGDPVRVWSGCTDHPGTYTGGC